MPRISSLVVVAQNIFNPANTPLDVFGIYYPKAGYILAADYADCSLPRCLVWGSHLSMSRQKPAMLPT